MENDERFGNAAEGDANVYDVGLIDVKVPAGSDEEGRKGRKGRERRKGRAGREGRRRGLAPAVVRGGACRVGARA